MGVPMIPPLRCGDCRHFRGLVDAGDGPRGFEPDVLPACAAFPEGIPGDIRDGTFDHARPHDGDHGVRYEPVAGPDRRAGAGPDFEE